MYVYLHSSHHYRTVVAKFWLEVLFCVLGQIVPSLKMGVTTKAKAAATPPVKMKWKWVKADATLSYNYEMAIKREAERDRKRKHAAAVAKENSVVMEPLPAVAGNDTASDANSKLVCWTFH